MESKVRTCLWFREHGYDAAKRYVSLLPGSEIEAAMQPDENGVPSVIEFTLAGVPYLILNTGPAPEFGPAMSISVLTDDQAETDQLWNALLADGGEASRCGWLKDRFGVHWQVVPKALPKLLGSDDTEAAARARDAMMTMAKIEIAAMEAAFRGE